jgi:hypothetical protein
MPKLKKSKNNLYALPRWFWVTLVAVVLVIVSSIGYFFYWQTGWPGYLHALDKCGGHPPIRASSPILYGNSTYVTPNDKSYAIPGKVHSGAEYHYFCTEDEARMAGFEHEEL